MSVIQHLAANLINDVLDGQNLNDALQKTYQKQSELAPAERAALRDLSFGSLRHYGYLRGVLAQLVKKPLSDLYIDALLIVALYQLEFTKAPDYAVVDGAVKEAARHAKGKLKGLTNGVLRSFLREKKSILDKIQHDVIARWNHPEWWINDVKKAYPKHWQQILTAGNQHPPMSLRVNLRHNSVTEYLHKLEAADIAARRLNDSKDSPIVLKQPLAVEKLPEFFDGACSVQDIGAQAAAKWLAAADGLRVLDACAAPGGKACHLLEMHNLDLLALDLDAQRLARVEENLKRLKLSARTQCGDVLQAKTWWNGEPFDRILADLPCSASGVVRRQPDVKWNRSAHDIEQFAAQQAKMLDALWPMLRAGGKMLYATCSIFPQENQEQIDRFLIRHADAELRQSEHWLPNHEHDGFYYALLHKRQ